MEIKVDALGEMCPVPVLRVIALLSEYDKIVLVTDHSCTRINIEEYFRHLPYQISVDEVMNGIWEIIISREKSTLHGQRFC